MLQVSNFFKKIGKKKKFYTKDEFVGELYDIGEYTYGTPFVHTHGDTRLKIGKFCSIANGVNIVLGLNHRIDWITTYPFPTLQLMNEFPEAAEIEGHPSTKGDVIIGNDVWIGNDAWILSGVTIGDGAVIGAKAVVSKDVAPYSIVVGNPAKCVKKRFDDDTIERLLKLQWWNWPIEKIRKAIPLLCSMDVVKLINCELSQSS